VSVAHTGRDNSAAEPDVCGEPAASPQELEASGVAGCNADRLHESVAGDVHGELLNVVVVGLVAEHLSSDVDG
jgi:hypothetical protein